MGLHLNVLAFFARSLNFLLAFGLAAEFCVRLPGLWVEDEESTWHQLLMHFEEESLDARVAEIKVNPLDGRKAHDHIEAFLCATFTNIFDVILAPELYSFTKLSRVDDALVNRLGVFTRRRQELTLTLE